MSAFSFGLIYKITCLVNGKAYVGQTIRAPEIRWAAHRSPSKKPSYIQKAIKKHGKENFVFEVLCQANSRESLNYLEDYFISYFDCLAPKGYTCVGSRGKDSAISSETRKKMSLAKKGRPALNKGKKMSAESRAKMSAAKIGKKRTHIGKPISEETRAKMSAARKGKTYLSPEQYAANGARHRGKTLSQEHKEAIKAAQTGRVMAEHVKAQISLKKLRYKYIGRNLTDGSEVSYCTPKQIREAGFNYSCVVAVCKVNSNRNQHKGYCWKKLRIS